MTATETQPMLGDERLMPEHQAAKPNRRTMRFSIVTPTLNAARYLPECLASIEAQKEQGVEVEHLILDGGSTDGTLEILKSSHARQLPRSREDRLVDAVRKGYQLAEGDLVSFLGADDLLLPGALASVRDLWQRERLPLILGGNQWCDAQLQSRGGLTPAPHWVSSQMHACLGWNYISMTATFMTPDLYRELGEFDPHFAPTEDYEFFTRALAAKVPFSRLHRPISLFRFHNETETSRRKSEQNRCHQLIIDRYGPKSRAVQLLLKGGFKSWIYLRHPAWARHQIQNKIQRRKLRG